jgi:hypothetical protein
MDPRVASLTTIRECEAFAKNATDRGSPHLAAEAIERAVQIRAADHGAESTVERECLEAIYAYEEILTAENGKRTRASRTWPLIKRIGIIPAVERIVTKREVSVAFTALSEMGLLHYAFEAVVIRHPEHFTAEALRLSRERTVQGDV